MTRATQAQWAERVKRWRASGQSAPVFAQGAGFNAGTLRWWASRLGSAAKVRGRFVEVVVPTSGSEGRVGVVARDGRGAAGGATDATVEGRVEVVLRDGLSIRVTGAFDSAVLRRVVAALGER